MLKLYKHDASGRPTHYHEAWVHGSQIIEHWGTLGERGENRQHPRDPKRSEEADIERVLAKAIANGYEPLGEDAESILIIEYPVKGMGTGQDLDKRGAVEDLMNEVLGWTGLGMCDGGSIGSGSMEVVCVVADYDTAQRVIAAELKGTIYADYSRIYNEGAAGH